MKDIKFSCLPLSLYEDIYAGTISVLQLSNLASEMEYDGIDINEYFINDLSLYGIADLRKKLAVPVVSMCVYSDFTNNDPLVIEKEVQRAITNIKKAAAIGAKYVRLTAGPSYPYCNNHSTITQIYDCFAKCVSVAEEYNITVLLENHLKALSWDHLDYNFNYDRMLLLWKRLKTLPVAINFDTANSYALGNWQGLLEELLPRIEAIHINDIASMDPFRCAVAGEGIVCIENMLDKIFEHGYSGWITIEEAGFEGTEGMARAIKNMRKVILNEK